MCVTIDKIKPAGQIMTFQTALDLIKRLNSDPEEEATYFVFPLPGDKAKVGILNEDKIFELFL